LLLGPRRLLPLSLAGAQYGEVLKRQLERQLLAPTPGRLDGRFAVRTGVPDRFAAGLSGHEERIFADISDSPVPLDRLLASKAQNVTLNRLVARGLAHVSGFTPSDAAHILGRQSNWDADAARLGAALFCRRRDGRGRLLASNPEELSAMVLKALTRRSAELMLEAAFAEDGLDGAATVAHALVQRSVDAHPGIAGLSLHLDRPVIGLGASAPLHYAALPEFIGCECIVPPDTDVANALGAVVGQVRVAVEVSVSQPKEGLYRVAALDGIEDFTSEGQALDRAEAIVREAAASAAERAGTDLAHIDVDRDIRAATIEGQRRFVEAIITAVASGRPRIAA
jgi:N-methylhydantoinase A/oxoprolinase/acetone carboxylase beta subunit